jgi:hypothetical protein
MAENTKKRGCGFGLRPLFQYISINKETIHPMRKCSRFIILPVLAISLFATAQEQSTPTDDKNTAPWFVDRFRLTGGVFVPFSNTNLQVSINGDVAGTEIDLEEDLGFTNSQLTLMGNFQWRMAKRSRLNFNYYNIPRSANHTLDRDIDFDGETYPVHADVHSYFNTAIYQLSYGYAVLSKPKYELGFLIGTHLVGTEAGISVESGSGKASGSRGFDFTAPIPDLAIWGGLALSQRLAFSFDVNYLPYELDNISGKIFTYNCLFMYNVIPHLDVSAGFSGLNFDILIEKERREGSFNWAYNGLALGLTYSFGQQTWK